MNSPETRQALRELLPWYENDTLSPNERSEVHALLASDLEAHRQRRELRALREALSKDPILSPNMSSNLRALQARLDGAPKSRAFERTGFWFAATALLILTLGATMLYVGGRAGRYHTLTASQPIPVTDDVELVRVDVTAGVSADELANIAGDAQVRVVLGPSAHGVATLAVPREQRAQVLARLQRDPRLLFISEIPH